MGEKFGGGGEGREVIKKQEREGEREREQIQRQIRGFRY